MSTTTNKHAETHESSDTPVPGTQPAAASAAVNPLTHGRLPTWGPWAIAAGALAISGIIFAIIAGTTGAEFNLTGMIVLGALIALVAIWAISFAVEGSRQASNRFVTSLVTGAFLLALVPLVSLLVTLIINGAPRFDAEFFSSSMRGVVSVGGGGLHAIVGTLLITLTATLISVPIGIFTAIYTVEYGGDGWLKRAINFFVDVMTGIPSIVAGLFAFTLVFALLSNAPGFSPVNAKTGFAGAIALTVLMIPTVVRSTQEMLQLVPNELREASYALGVPKWLTISKVVLPTALAGISTGVTLAISRVIGESAPLLVAAGVAASGMNYNLFAGQMMSLPVFVYQMTKGTGAAQAAWYELAWTAALVLLVIVMVLNLGARLISFFFSPKSR